MSDWKYTETVKTAKVLVNFGNDEEPLWIDPQLIVAVYRDGDITEIIAGGEELSTLTSVKDVVSRFARSTNG